MAPSTHDNYTTRIATMYSLFSCTYMLLYMFILFYFKSVYNIGKRACMPLIAGIALAECFKLALYHIAHETANPRERSNKPKKYHLRNVFKSALVISIMVVVYYIIAVLFGAPFTLEQEETLMFSLLLTVLTVLPSCLTLGADATVSVLTGLTTVQNDLIVDAVKHNVCFTLFGAWIGAVVIPLDWDRPWQVWPIPCSLGAIVGYTSAHIVSLINFAPKFTKLFVNKTGKYGL